MRPYNTSKLQFRTSKCLFLGYSNDHKGYKCLHSSGKIYVSKTVEFHEHEFPFPEFFPSEKSQPDARLSHSHIFCPPTDINIPHTTFPVNPSSTASVNVPQSLSPTYSSLHSSDYSSGSRPTTSTNSTHLSSQPTNNHPMLTRSKTGTLKPRVFNTETSPREPDCVSEALQCSKWKSAMIDEYNVLQDKGTWVLVPKTEHMNIISTKWIFRIKHKADGQVDRYKARLVARGFQQNAGIDYFSTFSPVVKPLTLHIIFSLAVTKRWIIQQVDINNAFLNGTLHETVYIQQPEGFLDPDKPTHVCKLKKSLYGLKQAPKAWYELLRPLLLRQASVTHNPIIASFIRP